MDDQSFLLTLRNAAKACPDALLRELAYDVANQLSVAITALSVRASPDNMRRVNSSWAIAHLTLNQLTTSGDDNSRGGAMPVPQAERMAA